MESATPAAPLKIHPAGNHETSFPGNGGAKKDEDRNEERRNLMGRAF